MQIDNGIYKSYKGEFMRTFRSFIALFIVFVLMIQMMPVLKVKAEEVVFEDPALEQAIIDHRGYEGPITVSYLEGLSFLNIENYGIESLNGLEYATNMKYLMMSDNQITDISSLTTMKNLRSVEFKNNQIKDLTPLTLLKELNHIMASNNQISNIGITSGLTKLEEIYIAGNNVSDLTPLKKIISLKVLDVSNNNVLSIEPVRDLVSLNNLNFSGNSVRDITPLMNLRNLEKLDAAGNCINLNSKTNKSVIEFMQKNNIDFNVDDQDTRGQDISIDEEQDIKLKWNTLYDDELADSDYHVSVNNYAYGNGIYVSIEGYTSKDGVKWKKNANFNRKYPFSGIVWGKNKFVALGGFYDDGKTWTSKDGINWTENKQKFDANGAMNDITFNGKIFVAVGGNNYGGRIVSSSDGVNWTVRSKDIPTDVKGIAWGNGTFVAMGYQESVCAVSKDGIKWKKVKLPTKESLWDICFVNGTFIAVGNWAFITSKDGVKWTAHSSNGYYWNEIYKVKDRYFLEGFKYVDERTKKESIKISRTSKDGKTWTDIKSKSEGFQIKNITSDGKKYYSYPLEGTFTSTDGVNWKLSQKENIRPWSLSRSAVGNGKLVAVGGDLDRMDPEIEKKDFRFCLQISSNGTYKYASDIGKYPLNDVIWTGKNFFAVGYGGTMMTSRDGLKWEKQKSPTGESLNRIIKVKNTYYVVGSNGLILSSKNLKTWTKQKTNVKSELKSIAWNGKSFVAVGSESLMLISDNGTKWTKIKRSDKNDYSDIVWAKGNFVVTSFDTISYDNNSKMASMIYKSTDGKKWSETVMEDNWGRDGKGEGFYGIVFTGDMFVALGCGGTISLSKDAIHWTLQDDVKGLIAFTNGQVLDGKMYVISLREIVYFADLKSISK